MDGKAGPVDTNDASEMPFDVTIKLNKQTRHRQRRLRAGLPRDLKDWFRSMATSPRAAHTLQLKGSIQAEHLKLAKAGKPATKTVGFDFVLNNDLRQRSGALTRGEVHIGKAKAELTGTYVIKNNNTVLHVKLAAPAMQVEELAAMLPALDIVLPQGSSLAGGTAAANVTVDGETDKLVSDGSVAIQKTRLAHFDLGSRMNTVAKADRHQDQSTTPISSTTSAPACISDLSGVKIEKISVIAPAIGELLGDGTLQSHQRFGFQNARPISPHWRRLEHPESFRQNIRPLFYSRNLRRSQVCARHQGYGGWDRGAETEAAHQLRHRQRGHRHCGPV